MHAVLIVPPGDRILDVDVEPDAAGMAPEHVTQDLPADWKGGVLIEHRGVRYELVGLARVVWRLRMVMPGRLAIYSCDTRATLGLPARPHPVTPVVVDDDRIILECPPDPDVALVVPDSPVVQPVAVRAEGWRVALSAHADLSEPVGTIPRYRLTLPDDSTWTGTLAGTRDDVIYLEPLGTTWSVDEYKRLARFLGGSRGMTFVRVDNGGAPVAPPFGVTLRAVGFERVDTRRPFPRGTLSVTPVGSPG